MSSKNIRDTELDYLLGMDNTIEVQTDQGYWVKFQARLTEVTMDQPHGIKYSLTLHAPTGERLIGFDNAHAVPPSGSSLKNTGRKFTFDHQHRHANDVGLLYQFDTPFQLVSDFYTEVDRVLKNLCK